MMLHGAIIGELEIRASPGGGRRLHGRFPFNSRAMLGPRRFEQFAPGAFEPAGDVALLAQHDFAKPLASTATGTLTLRSTADALEIDADINPAVAETTWARDTLAIVEARLATGLSPGFRVPPGGESVAETGDAMLRTITRAELHEISIVTRPAYADAKVEARSWQATVAFDKGKAFRQWRL